MGYKHSEDTGKHSLWRILLIITNILLYMASIALSVVSNIDIEGSNLFLSRIGNISRKYSNKLNPTGDTFSIWYAIYGWQFTYMAYTLSLLCRKTKDGAYLYTTPGHVPSAFYGMYITATVLITSWSFLFDREKIELAVVFLFLLTLSLYTCGVIVCRGLERAGGELLRQGVGQDIWLTRFIILNAIAIYATWCTAATWLSFASVLQHSAGVDAITCAWISLSILAAKVVVWFILETFVFDRYLRYCYMQYVVLIVAFAGSFNQHYNPDNPEDYTYFILSLLALSGVLGLVKFINIVVRSITQPITYKSDFDAAEHAIVG